jgi:hypothetical protein
MSGNDDPAKLRDSLFEESGGKVLYDSQTKKDPDKEYAGEIRGYYPESGGRWKPGSSLFNGRTDWQGKSSHKGVDIYAPYFPYPLETPVRAICSGWMQVKSGTTLKDGLGNRVAIHYAQIKGSAFIYGHLNRVRGRSRNVKIGEIVGYSGCTGNADVQGECSNFGLLNINSGHVHLRHDKPVPGDTKGIGVVVDPLSVLPWKLRFVDFPGELSATKWAEQGYRLDKPPTRDGVSGLIVVSARGPENRKKSAPPKPCGLIDVDHKDAIAQTQTAYAYMETRLQSPDHPTYKFQQVGLKSWTAMLKSLSDLVERMRKQTAAIEFSTAEAERGKSPKQTSAELLRYLLNVNRALWLTFGGSAILALVTNPTEHIKGGAAPDCGIGLNGTTWAVAVDHGESALHMSRLQNADGTMRSWTASVTFGAGTEWHAVLDDTIRAGLAGKTLPLQYLDRVEALIIRVMRLNRFVTTNAMGINTRNQTTLGVLAAFMAQVTDKIVELADKQHAMPDEDVLLLLRVIASSGKEACAVALHAFDAQNLKTTRWTPSLSLLALDVPAIV